MHTTPRRRAPAQVVVHKGLDVFSKEMEALLHRATGEASWSCAVGTHLCGALSPRLAALYAGPAGRGLGGLVLSPCCLKGWLGKAVQKRAKAEARAHYPVLVEELAALVQSECGSRDTVEASFDTAVLSEKNGYIFAARLASGVPGS